MSTASLTTGGHYAPITTTTGAYSTVSPTGHYADSPTLASGSFHSNQGMSPNSPSAQRQHRRQHTTDSPTTHTYSLSNPQINTTAAPAGYHTPTSSIPYHSRNPSSTVDQYDGAPVPPPRTSSQQQASPHTPMNSPADSRGTGSRRKTGENSAQSGRERHRSENLSAHKPAKTENSGNPPAPLVREYSEVINRVVVSDPIVDAERMQERVAEAQPAPIESEYTNAEVARSGAGEEEGRSQNKRQDFSKTTSRRRDVQFGDYMLGQTLGEGEFGKVKLGWKRDGSSQVAIKLIRRETVASNPSRLPKIYREISILRDLSHPNIVRLHEMVETERHIGIILEYASGGELFDYILTHRYLKDPTARRLFAQLVSGVGYLHKKGIVHRDLKLENLLLDQNRNIIITDFGFANTFNPVDILSDDIEYNLTNRDFVRKFKLDRLDANGMRRGDLMQTSCGSPCYAAPELVVSDSLYTGRKVDVWSCGVILYAMLAGYLPFDDDPANPEGDNINLLYKYITTTALTFPEYVSPHARDLLRRILVPDPRKRADLFEVARHSWLSEFHHVVSHVTSSTTDIADIANTTVPTEPGYETPSVGRSASVREPSKPVNKTSPKLARTPEVRNEGEVETSNSRRGGGTRHTLQAEYVPPQTHTARVAPTSATTESPRSRGEQDRRVQASTAQSPPSSKIPPQESSQVSPTGQTNTSASSQRMPPPVRPARDVPRSVSDSAGAFGVPTSQYTTRPSTQGSMTSANGAVGTRSDVRLPSRGSYGQPVAPTVATTNAQGSVTQPSKNTNVYNISGPSSSQAPPTSIGQPTTTPMPPQNAAQARPNHHKRTSTLSGLGERLFGRSNSVVRKDPDRQKNGRKYPPTAMKDPYVVEAQPRMSGESKRSFSFGLGKKKSSDMYAEGEKPSKRFSLIPSSVSFKSSNGNKEFGSGYDSPTDLNQPQSSRPQTSGVHSNQISSHDGPPDSNRSNRYNNFSRPPQPQTQYRQSSTPTTQPPNDVYGGTGVYRPQTNSPHQRHVSQPTHQVLSQYPEGSIEPPQSRHGRTVLTKPHRKFTDAYDNDHGMANKSSSSGAVKKVQDFFRRRRARADSDYR